MRLHEHEAAEIFERYGIPYPQRILCHDVDSIFEACKKVGFPCILKAQVLVGSRGLKGGIRRVQDPKDLKRESESLLFHEMDGLRPDGILVEPLVDVDKELYLGIAVDGYEGRPVVVISEVGGVNVEMASKTDPSKVKTCYVDPAMGFRPYMARNLVRELGMKDGLLVRISQALYGLYQAFVEYEALIAEVNPMAITKSGELVALDAVLEIDNSAIRRLRHKVPNPIQRISNPLERRGREIGVTYVDLEGDIAIISSGAGLGMASVDIIGERLRPANFLETGGGITEKLLYDCMDLVTSKAGIRAVFINVYGGINPIHEGAKGVVRFIKERDLKIPVVAKALGNRQEETWEILRSAGVHVVTDTATEVAVKRLCEILGQ